MTEPTRRSAPERDTPAVPPMRDAVAGTPAVPAAPGGVVPGGGGPVRPDAVGGGVVQPHADAEASGTESGIDAGADVDPGAARPEPPAERVHIKRTRISGLWTGIVIAAVVLLLLLVFILQNNNYVTIHFFGWGGQFPLGAALLLAAICGVLLVAVPGYGRIIQLRRAAHRAGRAK